MLERLANVERAEIDGCDYYQLSGICWALRLDQSKATRAVDKADKRYVYKFKRGYRSAVFCFISRAGIESLAIRFSGQIGMPRHELMALLPA